jgi:imidazolonepropionase-like amidohydrolase
VVRLASLTPAERAGVARNVGSLEKGKLADVLVLDRKLTVKRVFIAGQEFRGRKQGALRTTKTPGSSENILIQELKP